MNIKSIKKTVSSSIRNKGIISLLVPLILIVLFASIYYPSRQKEVSLAYAETQVKTLGEMLAFSVGAGLNDSNFDLVQTAFNWIKKDKNVVYTAIIDETNSVLIEHNPNKLNVNPATLSKFEFDEKSNSYKNLVVIEYKGKNFGHIAMIYSMDEVSSEIKAGTIKAILISIGMLIIGIIIVVLLFNRISKGIVNLRDAVKLASEGNLDHQLEKNSDDEIGDLTVAFNKMVTNIQKTNEALEEEKRSVEQKVDKAVEESEKQKEYLSSSIENILNEMNKFADGDLTVNLVLEKEDEIGKLYKGFNNAVVNTRNIILSVTEAVQATASASNQISTSTEEMAAGAQEQSSQTTDVASAVAEMTRTILDTTKSSSAAAESARNAGIIAREGGKVVNQTIDGMNRVAEVVKKSALTVQELGNSSNQIGEIVQVIDDIADQTNLLALNAAIEAARAGEQGRGFAVVADEVRKLAERTTKATKEIASMIRQIQLETKGAVESMNEGTAEVEMGKTLADKAGKSLTEIIKGSEEVVDMVAQVAAASEEQSATAEQISKNIAGINSIAQESAQGVQQIARASEDLNRLTENLQELILRFKIDDNMKDSGVNHLNSRRNITDISKGRFLNN